MFTVGKLNIDRGILLAPMEDVSDVSFRIVCKEFGADIVYTEFVNAEGLVRASEKTHRKLKIIDEERPVAIQIYGSNIESMKGAAVIAEAENPDFIDINAGCWVKNVFNGGAGAGLLKDPENMQKLVKEVIGSVSLPVTVKTRLGIDAGNIKILEVAKRLEDVGVAALIVHCRTRAQGHKGDADWSWITEIKKVVSIPVGLNGNVMDAYDVKRAFDESGADAVMIARGAIGNPWIFREAKELISQGAIFSVPDEEERIKTALKHLYLGITIKGEKRAVLEHRKYYSGYLKGLHGVSQKRAELMKLTEYSQVEDLLLKYLEELRNYNITV